MKKLAIVLSCLALVLTFSVQVMAGKGGNKSDCTTIHGGEFDNVYQFLQKNVVNRTLSRQAEGTIAGGTIAYEFQRDMTICNLVRTKNRFSYDVIYVIKQRNWDLKDGKKSGDPRIEDRMMVTRFELGNRKSTGEVVGFLRSVTSTRADWGGSTSTLRMKTEDETLLVEVKTGIYSDYFAAGGKYYPGASESNQQWFIRDGKLVLESRNKVYRVDPETGKKELVNDSDKPKVDTESAKLPLE